MEIKGSLSADLQAAQGYKSSFREIYKRRIDADEV
jgi:hypothetical protein